MKIINYFIKYPTWTNTFKIIAVIFGIIAILNIKSSFFPELPSKSIVIQIVYPGASPEEIEQGVVQKIEDNLKSVLGIERYTSTSQENFATISIEVFKDYNTDEVLIDVKNAVDRISSFPAGMEPPVVYKVPNVDFAITFSLSGNVDLKTLKKYAQNIEHDLRQIEGISQINITGYPEEEIVISLKEDILRAYNLTFDQVSRAVRSANLDLSTGSIKTDNEELLIRLKTKQYYAEFLNDIPVKATIDGKLIKLRDIATVSNEWAEDPKRSFVNGQPSVIVNVQKSEGEDILKIAKNVRNYIQEFNQKNTGIKATVIDDFTINLRQRLDLLISNGIQGAILVILVLALSLNLRLAFWVSLSLPFSFLGMYLVGYITGLTINVISLFGAIIVVGMLVDNSVVVSEVIFKNYEKGYSPYKSASEGVRQILPSIIFSVLTTVVMFLPFFFLDGRSGKQMPDMAFVVIVALIFSFVESIFILPVHLAHSKALRQSQEPGKIREFINKSLAYTRDVIYASVLKFMLKYKIIAFAIAIFMTIVTIAAFQSGLIGFTFFPFIDFDSFEISLKMPAGTRENITKQYLDIIEKAVWEVNEDFKKQRKDGKDVILTTRTNVGVGASGLFGATGVGGSNTGTIKVILLNGEERNMESFIIANAIRDKVGPIYEAEEVIYGAGSIFGKPISISLVGPDLNDLISIKKELKEQISHLPEVRDVSDNDPKGSREIKIKLKEKAYLLGFNNLEIARQIRQGFFGDEIQRLQRGEDEIKVWVRYSLDDRSSLKKFEEMRLRLPNGSEYALNELIDYEIERGSIAINHVDGMREIKVEADLADQHAEVPPILERINREILNPLLKKYPSVKRATSGQLREVTKTAVSAQVALPIALIVWFLLIALCFRSYLQAIVVILLVPLSFIGAVWGHFIQGIPLSIMSIYGFVALMGIIVNNSIVQINTMNDYLKAGEKFDDAVFKAVIDRFRPVLLTTITTFFGLMPLLFEKSRQAQFLIPMAATVAFGLLFGTFLTLLFLPTLITLLNKFRVYVWWFFKGEKPEKEMVEPAIIEQKNLEQYANDKNF